MCRVIKVSGESLSPLLEEGDFVLMLKVPFLFLRTGDVIAFHHPAYGTMIKLIESKLQKEGLVFAVGTHALSTDSRDFGPIPKSDIIGKVVWRVRKGV